MTAFEVAQKIDISAVRTQHTLHDIEEIVAYAKQYKFINVHVLPSWIKVLAPMIADEPDVYVGAPVRLSLRRSHNGNKNHRGAADDP